MNVRQIDRDLLPQPCSQPPEKMFPLCFNRCGPRTTRTFLGGDPRLSQSQEHHQLLRISLTCRIVLLMPLERLPTGYSPIPTLNPPFLLRPSRLVPHAANDTLSLPSIHHQILGVSFISLSIMSTVHFQGYFETVSLHYFSLLLGMRKAVPQKLGP